MTAMQDMFQLLSGVQSNGGLMAVLLWIVLELKAIRGWMKRHEDDYVHTHRRPAHIYTGE
jgi:hypothetical protein